MTEKYKTFYFCALQSLLFAILIFLFWSKEYPAHLYFHEQYQMFQFSWHYFYETVALPGGLGHYLSRFIVQFFYDATVGAAVMSGLLTAIQMSTMLHLQLRPSEGRWKMYPLSFIPALAIWVFMLNADAMPAFAIVLLMSLLMSYVCKLINGKNVRRVIGLLVGVLLFITFGGGSLCFFLLMGMWEVQQSIRHGSYAEGVVSAMVSVILFFTVPIIGQYLYNFPYGQLLVGYDTYRYPLFTSLARPMSIFCVVLTVLAIQYLPSFGGKRVSIIMLFLIILGGFLTIYVNMNRSEEICFRYNYWERTEQWDAILEQSQRKEPKTELELCCVNLALAKQGKLCDQMFMYSSQSRQALIPDYRMDYMTPMIAGEVYYQMNLVNTAQRFAFEAQEAIPDYQKSARCYKRLVQTNIINGNYAVAAQYLRKLENTWYYKDWAIQMKSYLYNDSLVEADPLFGKMRKARYQEDFFFDERQMDAMLYMQLKEHPEEDVSRQYFWALCLINKRIAQLADDVTLYLQRNPESKLPRYVQEALLLWWAQKTNQMDELPWSIDDQVKNNLKNFLQAANQSSELAHRTVRKFYLDTFWGYTFEHQNKKR